MHSNQEPNSLFGGMAVPQLNSYANGKYESDPADQYSWLFKIEMENKQLII